ncbi:MAG: gfo/Idh/MocA family oxidoreductase, partial [Mesorhizobium sp.]
MVGVGLIGTGFMGKCHAIAWSAVGTVFPDVAKPRLVHLGEVNDELARRKAGEFG